MMVSEADDLDVLTKKILSMPKQELNTYFSQESSNHNFTNSQLYFNMFSRKYKLHDDGEFDKMCEAIKDLLGKELYSQLMDNLYFLRNKKIDEIIKNTGEFLTHTSNISPEAMNGSIIPRNNLNQFGEKRDNFVFATDSESERDFYALRTVDREGKNINWKKRANVDGEEKNVFILEAVNRESYTYFLPKEKFTPVVCLDGRFGHEWTATEEVAYSHYEKNNAEEIQKRNIVKVVDRDRFNSQSEDFYKGLNDANNIVNILDNSDVLAKNRDGGFVLKLAQLRGIVQGTPKPPVKQPSASNPAIQPVIINKVIENKLNKTSI